MAQIIKNANIFGRIGTSLGQGLAEQVPKEIEHYRHRTGLQELAEQAGSDSELTPLQFLAKAAGTYGITPQEIQSFSELAKHQNLSNAYRNAAGAGRSQGKPEASPDLTQNQMANLVQDASQRQNIGRQPQQMPFTGQVNNQQRTPNVGPQEAGQPQVVNENPLNEKNFTRPPWTPQQRNDRVGQYIDQGFLPDQAQALTADDESRDLASPKAYQERFRELEENQTKARSALRDQLETKLQKKGENLFKDISGEMLINLERGMERDLRSNPKATVNDVVNDWSNRALDLAKTKSQFDKLSSTTGVEAFFKGKETLNKLKQYQKIFQNAGNAEEYYNLLQQGTSPEIVNEKGQVTTPAKSGLGLSAQAAASIAYPIDDSVKNYVGKTKVNPIDNMVGRETNARKAATDIEEYLKSSDASLLSIAHALKSKDPFFDQEAFFDELNQNQDQLRLNQRQRREIAEGASSLTPNWGDILILPFFRR